MADLQGFNADDHPPVSFEPVPAGDYLAMAVESEMKDTKNGNGRFLSVQFRIMDGPHKGRTLYHNFNLLNPNPQAVQIAKGELSAFCLAVGVKQPGDSQALHNLPLILSVTCKKRKDTGEIENAIKAFKNRHQQKAQPQNAPANAPQHAPWKPPTDQGQQPQPAPWRASGSQEPGSAS